MTRLQFTTERKVALKGTDAYALVNEFTNAAGKTGYLAKVYRSSKVKKPLFYQFRSENDRSKWVSQEFASIKSSMEYKAKWKAEAKEKQVQAMKEVKVGDIYYASGGYDQTNVSFYKVIELVGNASVKLVSIGMNSVEGSEGFMSDYVIPDPSATGTKTFIKRIGSGGSVKIDNCSYARKWDGSKKYRSWYA